MKTTHTPGPWSYRAPYAFTNHHAVVIPGAPRAREEGMHSQLIHTGGTAEDAANARLIAAAPELLEALKESHNQLVTILADMQGYGFSNERINMTSAAIFVASKAIAKAEGNA